MANTKKPLRVQKPEPEPERGQNGGWLAAGGAGAILNIRALYY
jgi:hypothetical protein